MPDNVRESFWTRCGDVTPRDWRNQKRVLWRLLVWAVCFVGASQAIKRGLLAEGPIPWLAAALPAVAWVLVLVAYTRFLREADELQRTIQLHALALGFGAGLLASFGYQNFERLGAPAADSGDYALVMILFYAIGTVLGMRRYR